MSLGGGGGRVVREEQLSLGGGRGEGSEGGTVVPGRGGGWGQRVVK